MNFTKLKRLLLVFAVPFLFTIAMADEFPPKYHTYAEGISELRVLEISYPELCRLDSIGCSNRDSVAIYDFKISDNAVLDEDEPAVLLCGGVHADEILGPEIVLNFCRDILERYSSGDSSARRSVDNLEIFAIPFSNPEGHIVVENGDLDWRKNKTDNNGDGLFDFHDGVDGNRNYDFAWELDTTLGGLTPESLMYKGAYPFSEAESRAIAQFGQKYKPVIAVDYHSPTYGYSEIVFLCWYWSQLNRFSPDLPTMQSIGAGFASSIIKDDLQHSYSLGYGLVNKGDFKTYFYGNFGTAAFSCEVSDTTIQDTSLVDSICQRHLPGINYLLGRACRARISGQVTDSLTREPLLAEVRILEATGPEISPRFTRNNGRYDRLMIPGSYTLCVSKEGYATKTITGVSVTDSALSIYDIGLVPRLDPPDLISPYSNSFYDDSLSLYFSWTLCATATNYLLEIANDSLFQDIYESDSGLLENNFRNQISLGAGRYYWRVSSLNAYAPPARSAIRSFYINWAPSLPSLIYPLNGAGLDSSGNIIWMASTDPAPAESLSYWLQVSRNFDYGTPIIDYTIEPTQFIPTDTIVVAIQSIEGSSALLVDTAYYWRLKAIDSYNRTSDWTDGTDWFVFMPQNHPPGAPDSGFSPSNGEEIVSLMPLITWNDAHDPDGGGDSIKYAIRISVDSLFAGFVYCDTTDLGINQVQPSIDLNDNTHYFYQVKTLDDGGLESDWSLVQDFWINQFNSPPEPFPILDPAAGFRQVDYYSLFSWGSTVDHDPNSSFIYSIEITNDSLFRYMIWSRHGLADTSLTIATDSLIDAGPLYWRIIATDDDSLMRIGGIPEGPKYLLILPAGDANSNGATNGLDVTFLVNFLKGLGSAPDPLLAGDANGNCATNGLDVTYLVNYLKGLGGAPIRGVCTGESVR